MRAEPGRPNREYSTTHKSRLDRGRARRRGCGRGLVARVSDCHGDRVGVGDAAVGHCQFGGELAGRVVPVVDLPAGRGGAITEAPLVGDIRTVGGVDRGSLELDRVTNPDVGAVSRGISERRVLL